MATQPTESEFQKAYTKAYAVLKTRLLSELKKAQKEGTIRECATTKRDIRLLALRLAEKIANERSAPQLKDAIYDMFLEMMGMASRH